MDHESSAEGFAKHSRCERHINVKPSALHLVLALFEINRPITNKTAPVSNVLPARRRCQDRAPWRTGAAKERKSEKRLSDSALAGVTSAANKSRQIDHVRQCFAGDRSRKTPRRLPRWAGVKPGQRPSRALRGSVMMRTIKSFQSTCRDLSHMEYSIPRAVFHCTHPRFTGVVDFWISIERSGLHAIPDVSRPGKIAEGKPCKKKKTVSSQKTLFGGNHMKPYLDLADLDHPWLLGFITKL